MNLNLKRCLGLLLGCLLLGEGAAVVSAAKKPITHDVYDSWRSIQGTRLSQDGNWVAYALVPQDGDGELVARQLKTGQEFRHPRGKEPQFAADGSFLVFTITPPKAEMDKAKKDKKKPEDQPKGGLGIMKLSSGEVFTADRVKSFKLAENASRYVAYLLEAPAKKLDSKAGEDKKSEESTKPAGEREAKEKKEKKKDPGTELIVREMATGQQTSVAEVVEFVWSKDGQWLACAVSSKTPANDGVMVWTAASNQNRPVMTGLGHYKGLAIDEKGLQLAFLSDRDDYPADQPVYRLYHWATTGGNASELVTEKSSGLPPGWVINENGRLEFSKDGARLFLGTAPKPKPEPDDSSEIIKVDLWSWKDLELQPMQKVRADDEKKRSYRAVVHLAEKRFAQLAVLEVPNLTLIDHPRYALGVSNVPYKKLLSWDTGYDDVYLVNLRDGSKLRVVEKSEFPSSLSPGGQYVLYFDTLERDWYIYRMSDGRRINLTEKLKVSFQDETWDTPGTPRPYGLAGWTAQDQSILINDRYDLWEFKPDGSGARMITQGKGREGKVVFRYQRLDPEEKTIPADQPILLSATDDESKASGFYKVQINQPAGPEKLLWLDKQLGGVIKAKEADTLIFTQQRFEEFPDLWTCSLDFRNPARISHANPQQDDYVWGKSELMQYRNADGKMLKAVLIKPEDFDPARKYPLMVFIYEELSGGLHRYVAPAPGTSINATRYVSNGYVLLQPDIIYETGYPGQSAMKCVIPAIQALLAQGFVDPERIGIQGHSWGGYQITYMITQTSLFRAVEAGASVSNMISAYGGIRWGSGMSRAFQYEKTQSRIGAPPWDKTLEFIENSPIFWVERINTPYLTIHNDEDDAVPWYQGIELNTALRRLGKEAYLFNYNGEKHGLRERENQKHWTVHMAEFFDHYLKGAQRPEWMDKGVPFLERGKRDLNPFYKKPQAEIKK